MSNTFSAMAYFVLVTFDDGVNVININTYRNDLYNRLNTNGCPAGTTSSSTMNTPTIKLSTSSITVTPQTYWAEATYDDMKLEFGDQRIQMSHFANIPYDEIKVCQPKHLSNYRNPYPVPPMTGNASFQVMKDFGLTYDCTWPTINQLDPGLWPYTLDYESTQECTVPPCPTASIPGVWTLPMVSWLDLNGAACAMVDSCFAVPPLNDEDAWFNFIVTNFERHYLGNRSPFGFYVHEWYVAERINPRCQPCLR
ncbi:hypothetical protein MSG28_002560 [Choristoneura fumiferana]|uniref:Uncharacterized protein n=1 Tax=Choristoneura fumiferana TaxID=7141 RepID=A0ACC0JW09_CHOFU|nr:hypothetical protein MSG28_002560 [Choristoneura fumiferana]